MHAALALIAAVSSANATTYQQAMDIEDLSVRSERAVVGEVLDTWSERDENGVWTVATMLVDETLQGDHDPLVMMRWPGGQSGDIELIVSGAPQMNEGDHVVAFLSSTGHVVGMSQGAFTLNGDEARRDLSSLNFQEEGSATARDAYLLSEIRETLR